MSERLWRRYPAPQRAGPERPGPQGRKREVLIPPRPGNAVRLVVLAVVGALLLAGCRVDTTLTIDVKQDGSGVVRVRTTLDADAVRQAEANGGKLEDRIRVADLASAGWTASAWVRRPDGSATLVVRKPFASAADLHDVIAELSGPKGPVQDVALERDSGLLTTNFDVTGVADLSELSTAVLDDQEVVGRLTAERVDLPALDQRLAQQLRDAFHLRVVVRFPDGSTETVPAPTGERTEIEASSSDLDATRAGLLATAILLAALAIVILVRGERRGHR